MNVHTLKRNSQIYKLEVDLDNTKGSLLLKLGLIINIELVVETEATKACSITLRDDSSSVRLQTLRSSLGHEVLKVSGEENKKRS